MEILIEIPPWAVNFWENVCSYSDAVSQMMVQYAASVWGFVTYQRNGVWILMSMVIFWPLWVYFAVAITTASTWMFWLLASILLGIVQLIFVTYQFIMIVADVTVLTLLKTYQVLMRSCVVQRIFFFSKTLRNSRLKTSRRHKWKQQCEGAKTYADFLQLDVMEPNNNNDNNNNNEKKASSPRRDLQDDTKYSALKKRSRSFANMKTLYEEQSPSRKNRHDEDRPPTPRLKRMSSWVNRSRSLDEVMIQTTTSSEGVADGENSDDHHAIVQDLGSMMAELLLSTTLRLKEAREQFENHGNPNHSSPQRSKNKKPQQANPLEHRHSDNASSAPLKVLLSGVVKRNHLTLEDILVQNARSIAYNGQHQMSPSTRQAIASYYNEVSRALDTLADAPIDDKNDNNAGELMTDVDNARKELGDRMTLVRKMKQNMGRTALMLSGGGAQAMYHLGTIKALIDGGNYNDIKVISGTSGGSITAACCAMYTQEELLRDVCISTVSTDFKKDGSMKRDNIRWFPPVMDMGAYWFQHRLLVDSKYFYRTCEYYYGTTTFQEAFEKTGKHVCITVSASRASGGTAQRLLLNHISTPHVTLASAVAASCALPGVMKPAKLQIKNSLGDMEPFEVDGVEWIDGSVQADLPFQRISTLFNVSNYIVAQTNFHVVPFLNKDHHPSTRSAYWKLFQTIEWDIRSRALKLSRLGLFPRIFGQDISKVFKQKYHGHLTLVPRFTAAQTFGLKALVNPSVKEMEGYLKYGQLAAWPYLLVIRDMVRFEQALDECLAGLKERYQQLVPHDADGMSESATDDLDSIASGTIEMFSTAHSMVRNRGVVRFAGHDREVEKLKSKLKRVEMENKALQRQVAELKGLLGNNGNDDDPKTGEDQDEEKKTDEVINSKTVGDKKVELSEGGVWNLVRQLKMKQ